MAPCVPGRPPPQAVRAASVDGIPYPQDGNGTASNLSGGLKTFVSGGGSGREHFGENKCLYMKLFQSCACVKGLCCCFHFTDGKTEAQ